MVAAPPALRRWMGRDRSSGNTVTSFMHRPALWAGIGQVHIATYDNTVYAFGFAIERY